MTALNNSEFSIGLPEHRALQLVECASGKIVQVKTFGFLDYQESFNAMRAIANLRGDDRPDQIWCLQHPAVYTQGTACDQQPFVTGAIPLIKTDRGGQITYHGPGQAVIYPLLNLRRFDLGVKALVYALEQAVIKLLSDRGVTGSRWANAPGVYVNDEKIAALGLRIRRGMSYHGLSLNINMDLEPFANIDPCGYIGLRATQLSDHCRNVDFESTCEELLQHFCAQI